MQNAPILLAARPGREFVGARVSLVMALGSKNLFHEFIKRIFFWPRIFY